MTPTENLHALRRRNPEWAPWLAVIGELLEEIDDSSWDAAVPRAASTAQASRVPLLANAVVSVDPLGVRHSFARLARSAARSGAEKMKGVERLLDRGVDSCAVFGLALNHDRERLQSIARETGVEPEAFIAIAALLPMPFLHACNRAWSASVSASWREGYCGVCGAWPSFAEVRGIERARYLRCGSCGGQWQVHALLCPYCGTNEHEKLSSLVSDERGSASAIDVCDSCRGHLKVFARLQGAAPASVVLDDLGSAELDIAAAARGYARPSGVAYTLNVTVAEQGARDCRT